jgi:hypothetical protein
MNLPYYILLSQSESIELTKNRTIELPLSSRVIEDLGDQEKLVSEITNKLTNLNINEDSDYLMLLVSTPGASNNVVTLKIDDVLNQYCFTDGALIFYQTRINQNYSYEMLSSISLSIDIDSVIQKVQNKKIDELIEDKEVFNISIGDLPIDPEGTYEELITFKRECKLVKNDFSYFNDLVTIGVLLNNTSHSARHKSGENIAEKSKVLSEMNDIGAKEKNIKELVGLVDRESPHFNSLNSVLKDKFGTELEHFSFVVFVLVYLKIFDVYQNADNKISALHETFTDLSLLNQFQKEINSAYYIFLRTCGYSNLYTDYYQFKALKINTGSNEYSYSVLRTKLNVANSQIKIFGEAAAELGKFKQEIEHIKSESAQKDDELAKVNQELSIAQEQLRAELDGIKKEKNDMKSVLAQKEGELTKVNHELSAVQEMLRAESNGIKKEVLESELPQNISEQPEVGRYLSLDKGQPPKAQSINNSELINENFENDSIIIPIDKLSSLNITALTAIARFENDLEKRSRIDEVLVSKKG